MSDMINVKRKKDLFWFAVSEVAIHSQWPCCFVSIARQHVMVGEPAHFTVTGIQREEGGL